MPLPEVVLTDSHAPPRFPPGSNKHISVNAEDIKLVGLEFVEEPLGVTAEQGHGYIRVEFGGNRSFQGIQSGYFGTVFDRFFDPKLWPSSSNPWNGGVASKLYSTWQSSQETFWP